MFCSLTFPFDFNIFSLYLTFVNLTNMCFSMFLLGFILYETLHFLDLNDCFLSHFREVFGYNLFKCFLRPSPCLSLFWDPIMWMLVCLVLSQRSLRHFSFLFILFTLFCPVAAISIFFVLFCGSDFHFSVFQITYSFFCLSYFAIDFFLVYFSFHLLYYSSLCSFNLLSLC